MIYVFIYFAIYLIYSLILKLFFMYKRRAFVVILAIFFSFPSYSQIELKNQKSENHHLILGTGVSMVPPPNFSATGIPGFVFPTAQAAIFVSEIPEGKFSNIESELEEFIGDNRLIGQVEDVLINKFQGKFFTTEEIRDGDPFTNHNLFFGNEEFVYMVLGICPSDHPGIIESIKDSIFSIVYEPEAVE